MDYLNVLFQKWMPFRQRVEVDSTPKLHGISDTINSTLATPGPPTYLPSEFYDARARQIIDRVVTEEYFAGFKESNEYRTVGIGALLGEVVQRMIQTSTRAAEVQVSRREGEPITPYENAANDGSRRNESLKFALFGCHDSTLAAVLASLGTLEGKNDTWPSYTASLAIELFREKSGSLHHEHHQTSSSPAAPVPQYYVRLRYNEVPITIPGCRVKGRHLSGNESFCTLVSTSSRKHPT